MLTPLRDNERDDVAAHVDESANFASSIKSIRNGYLIAFLLLISITLFNYTTISYLSTTQINTSELTQTAQVQSGDLRRVSQIVGFILSNIEKDNLNKRLMNITSEEIQILTKKIDQNQLSFELGIHNLGKSKVLLAKNTEALENDLRKIREETAKLVTLLKTIPEIEMSDMAWRFSVWAPIQLALANQGKLMTSIDSIGEILYTESATLSKRLKEWHKVISAITLILLILEIVFIFIPLLDKVIRSNTKLFKINSRLVESIRTDSLTGLGNRLKLIEHIKQLSTKTLSTKRYLLLIDLDQFRSINDMYGHDIGDNVLLSVTKRLESGMPNGELFRIGGDELVATYEQLNTSKPVEIVASELLALIQQPMITPNATFSITASIGIAEFDIDSQQSMMSLLNQASYALNQAKKAGKNRVRSIQKQDAKTLAAKDQLTKKLTQALDNNEIIPFYQPIIDLKTGHWVGVEALARWIKPDGSCIYPSDFIPLMAQNALLGKLTECMLKAVSRDRESWIEQGYKIEFASVNFPESSLIDTDMPNRIKSLVNTDNLRWLHIEVVETAVLHHASDVIQANLQRYIDMGAHISLDDFGTGYASLSHLKDFPCNTIKVDRSFVSDALLSSGSYPIVKGIIEMSLGLNMQVIIEGIETDFQSQYFRAWPNLYAQGYFYAKPMPFEALLDALQKNNKKAS